MLQIAKLKRVINGFSNVLVLLPSILLIFCCFYVFAADNLLSFVCSIGIPILFVFNLLLGVYCLIKKKKHFLLALTALAIYFIYFDSFIQYNQVEEDLKKASSSKTLSLLSYNANGFNKNNGDNEDTDLKIINFIKSKNVDVFCIQEFSAIKYKYFLKEYPYFSKTNIVAGIGKSVMAIFSKYPITNKDYVNFPNSDNGAMYVDLKVNNQYIRIYNIHLESYKSDAMHQLNNPKSYSAVIKRIAKAEKTRKEQAVLVKNHIDNFGGKVITCGDFNATQFSSSYDILSDSMKDSFIESGKGFGSTYKLYNYPFRLDYILIDNNFKILSHENFELELSDHEPIISVIELE